jgi:coenzyme F420-reducing hydrogenase alpha subunit
MSDTSDTNDERAIRGIRRLAVKSLTRVEGEGALRVRVVDGRVEIAEFNIYEPPRFFEKLLVGREIREVPDMVARICGICPVAYQMSGCHALEKALGIRTTPAIERMRRLLYCGEWIQSHALHVHLLHAPDFLGFESGFTMAATHPALVEGGLRLKAVGSRLLETIGGRAVHPINVAVGGFHRAPSTAALQGLLPDLRWGLNRCLELVAETARFEFPDFQSPAECVALRMADEYPMNDGRIVSSGGLDIEPEEFPRHFSERQVPWSTALHAVRLPGETPYVVGPLARLNLCRDQLPPAARRAADDCGLAFPLTNPFTSIVARCLEMVAAFEEAVAIVESLTADLAPCRIAWEPRDGVGAHATEAPRGLLWHRYEIGGDGLVKAATIVPPTSQNQARIEADLRAMLPPLLAGDDAAATTACERLIRSYDPCISCATHFLRVEIDRRVGLDSEAAPQA